MKWSGRQKLTVCFHQTARCHIAKGIKQNPHKKQDTCVAKMQFFLNFKVEIIGGNELFLLFN